MKYTIKTLKINNEDEKLRKRMIEINRKLRGQFRALGGNTSSVVTIDKNDTSAK